VGGFARSRAKVEKVYTYVGNDPLDKTDPTGNESAGVAYDSVTQLADVRDADNSPEQADSDRMGIAAFSTLFPAEGLVGYAVDAYAAARFESRLEKVREGLSGWTETPNRKGVGSRVQDPNNKGNRVRVDKGNPNHDLPSRRQEHVVQQVNGKTVDANGNPIIATQPSKTPEAHIPLVDWLKNLFNEPPPPPSP